jgi:hypothetical protein
MLETFLAWAYLWPVSAGVLLVTLIGLLTINLLASLAIVGFYYLLPESLIDDFVRWSVESVREKFGHYFEKVESHLQSTFRMEGNPPPSSLLLWHPHSLMSITPTLHCSFRIHELQSKLVSHNIYHMFPVIKDFAKYANIIPADFEVMKKTLESGSSVSVIPGGVREMMTTKDEKTIRLVLKNRRGIFRLAMMTGSSLVPLLTYGEGELFPPVESTFMNIINGLTYSWFKIAMPITSLTAIQNWIELYYHPLSPVITHVGDAIKVEKVEAPTDAEIEKLREKYIESVQTLFTKTHPPEYTLIIE